MNENDYIEIEDTLKAASFYLNNLESLHKNLQTAMHQINTTTADSEKNIKETFHNLITKITKILTERQVTLLGKVAQIRNESLNPLKACQQIINTKMKETEAILAQGNELLSNKTSNFAQFKENSALLGSLPEVPELTEVPYVSYKYDQCLETDLVQKCTKIGRVTRIAPAQICGFREKPGGMLVDWQTVETDDRFFDIEQFRLQKAFGNVIKTPTLIANYADCYIGSDLQFLVKDMVVNQTYSFRVCCKYEGFNDWSQWSLDQIASTTIPPFRWHDNADFSLTNNSTIASLKPNASSSALISVNPVFTAGNSVEITYLEFGGKPATIGLIALPSNKNIDSIKSIKSSHHKYFAVDSSGDITIDGVVKSMKLSPAEKNLKVCFTCESTSISDKFRIHIDSNEKRVTYDWSVPTQNLIIAALLHSTDTKLIIE